MNHKQKAGKTRIKAALAVVLPSTSLCFNKAGSVLLPILWDEKHEVFKEERMGEKEILFLKHTDVPDNLNTSYVLFCLFF